MPETKPFKKLTYRLAVRDKCRQCCCGSYLEVKNCTSTKCALHSFRLGKSPKEKVNALDLLIFPEDPESTIYSIRKKDMNEDEDDMFIEDDEE